MPLRGPTRTGRREEGTREGSSGDPQTGGKGRVSSRGSLRTLPQTRSRSEVSPHWVTCFFVLPLFLDPFQDPPTPTKYLSGASRSLRSVSVVPNPTLRRRTCLPTYNPLTNFRRSSRRGVGATMGGRHGTPTGPNGSSRGGRTVSPVAARVAPGPETVHPASTQRRVAERKTDVVLLDPSKGTL